MMLVTLLVHLFVVQIGRNDFSASIRAVLLENFYPTSLSEDRQESSISLSTLKYDFVDMPSLFDFLASSVNAYYDFVSTTPGIFMYQTLPGGGSNATMILPPTLDVKYADTDWRTGHDVLNKNRLKQHTYVLGLDNPYGPFKKCVDGLARGYSPYGVYFPGHAMQHHPELCTAETFGEIDGAFLTCRAPHVEDACESMDSLVSVEFTAKITSVRLSCDGGLSCRTQHVDWTVHQLYNFNSHRGVVHFTIFF
eukprot:PhM_4_TR5689/c1_g1_i1/m.73883